MFRDEDINEIDEIEVRNRYFTFSPFTYMYNPYFPIPYQMSSPIPVMPMPFQFPMIRKEELNYRDIDEDFYDFSDSRKKYYHSPHHHYYPYYYNPYYYPYYHHKHYPYPPSPCGQWCMKRDFDQL